MTMLAVLYAVAMFGLLLYGLNLLWLAWRYAQAERLLPGPVPDPSEAPVPDASWPTVTVQIPLYNEAYVAQRIIDACARLCYPRRRLEIQVLDDSTDETTALVAQCVQHWRARGLNIVHIHRTHRKGYKAGALQNGLRLAGGSLIAIFDADFVPPPDFLPRLVPHFSDPAVGMVQARWGHLNEDDSLLTRLQAVGLDAHFAIEQYVRHRAGCFINFNGTAGVWRRACIEAAGGWQADTLTEDLDLSYRAQLAGWRFVFVPGVEVPAELPATMDALRDQQFRWAKGALETAQKTLKRLWRSAQPTTVKLEGTLHLTAHLAFPCVLVAAGLHAPLLLLEYLGQGPGPLFFAAMSIGLVGFAGFALAQVLAQRALYPTWVRRLNRLPLFMAGSMGLALSNTRALWQALRGTSTAFVRTPKWSNRLVRWRDSRYAARRLPRIVWLEALVTLYCAVGLLVLIAIGAWAAVPFQLLFALGFGLTAASSLRAYTTGRCPPTIVPG